MHRDKKLGLALGILLVGIVAAFFFRNKPRPVADLPRLKDALALDEAIEEKPIAPYVSEGSTGDADVADDPLAALEAHTAELNESVTSLVDDDWDFLQEGDSDDPLAAARPGPPAPIGYREATSSMAAADPELNDLNAGWEIAGDAATGFAGDRAAAARSGSPRNDRGNVSGVSGTESTTSRDAGRPGSTFHQTSGRGTGITSRYSRPADDHRVAEDSRSTRDHSTGFNGSAFSESTASKSRSPQTGTSRAAGSRESGRRTFRVREYRVQSGDTLTGLSSRFLGTHKRYRELYEANRDRLKDVDDLRVGMLIRIPEAGSRRPAGLAGSRQSGTDSTARATTSNRGAGTSTEQAAKSSRSTPPAAGNGEFDIDDLLADTNSEHTRRAAPPAGDNPFAGSEPPPRESFAGSGSARTAKPPTTSRPDDSIAETAAPSTRTADGPAARRETPVAPVRPVSQGRTRTGAVPSAGTANGTGAISSTAGDLTRTDSARPRTAAAGVRTPENPYGLYLIEPADAAEGTVEPARPTTNDRRPATAKPAAAPARKFVPAGTLPGSRRRYEEQSSHRDSRSSEGEPGLVKSRTASAKSSAAPRVWTVRRGDTLEGIAVRVYGRRSATTELFAANRDQLKNPNLLRVGMKIRLPELSR